MNKNFLLISQPISINTEIELFPGYKLKKPDRTQLEEIFNFYQFSSNIAFLMTRPKYETQERQIDEKITVQDHLEQSEWKYAIIEYEGMNYDYNLIDSLRFSDSRIEIICDIMLSISGKANDGLGYRDYDPLVTMVSNLNKKNEVYDLTKSTLDTTEILLVKNQLEILEKKKSEYPMTIDAIRAYKALSKLEKNSYLRILSLVSIIEYFIVHNPIDSNDSITRQIKNKFTLLNKLFHKPIQISEFFQKNISSDKVISSIYSLRSNIAHGITFDLHKEQVKYLESFDKVVNFLDAFCRRLIIFSILNTNLIKDIKNI
ncbi:HEPN domain-containing protein [Leptospira meyeri]|uniref:HEPN domain-containing protein n=1 Tax=Leptospira meyeri TaxID=29508 RepID=UPI000C2A381D|nr:HEPN domain-containing protein [Leptospira meyeri]PJZ79187.1 hypothetical protein CH359_19325 [Leptospira meyeri]PJZ94973.1 hypothetical protein CH358_19565 [Leptospira meyeri]